MLFHLFLALVALVALLEFQTRPRTKAIPFEITNLQKPKAAPWYHGKQWHKLLGMQYVEFTGAFPKHTKL
jgi:hypothetical protein